MAKSTYYTNKNLPPLYEIVAEVFTPEILEEPERGAANVRARRHPLSVPRGDRRG